MTSNIKALISIKIQLYCIAVLHNIIFYLLNKRKDLVQVDLDYVFPVITFLIASNFNRKGFLVLTKVECK